MTPQSEFRSYLDQFGSLPPDCLLGNLVMYGVSDGEYDGDKMAIDFAQLGLSPAFLPPPINPADAFEKATKALDNTRYALNPAGSGINTDHYAIILMREAARDKTRIVRKAIREIRDSKNAVLQYDEVAEFQFYRPVTKAGRVDYSSFRVRASRTATPVSVTEDAALTDLEATFQTQMDRHLKTHDGQKIRTLIRDYLRYLNATKMKASCYFVHNSRASEIEALQEFFERLGVSGTEIRLFPLADIPMLRENIVEAFQVQAVNDLLTIKDKVDKLRAARSGPISPTAYLKIKAEYDEILDQANETSRVLDVVQDTTSDAAMVALQAITDLGAEVAAAMNGVTP